MAKKSAVAELDDFELDFEDEEEEVETPKKKKKKSNADALVASAVQKIQDIKTQLSSVVFERERILDDVFRALAAGENILLLGDPGTGKTYLSELFFMHLDQANVFKWLFNRTTDPSDIVGPYSIKGMENDEFRRVTTGKLPVAHAAYMDEINLGLLA